MAMRTQTTFLERSTALSGTVTGVSSSSTTGGSSRASVPSARFGGPNQLTLQLESRLPIALRRFRFDLECGCWREPPPFEVGAYSSSSWVAAPQGFLGRNGVKGSVRFCCDWQGSVTMLHIAFECLLFGERRIVCLEETAEGTSCRTEDRVLCIHCQAMEGSASKAILHVVVELQSHLARYVSVDTHRMKSASAAENLRGGRLATVLRQSTRSCLVRITNLTQFRLAMDGRGVLDAQGFWVAEPSASIDPHSFADFGITSNGMSISTGGNLCYIVESPERNRERRVQICLEWDVPWLRQRSLKARDSGDVLAVKVFADRLQNLVGLVHIVDPRNLPTLEVLDAVALASRSGNGEDMTELVQEIARPHEVVIPSVRVLLGQAKRRTAWSPVSEEGVGESCNAYSGLQISYRIGPEVFRRVYSPSERVHLSAALPGGDGEEETVLAALEARGQETAVQVSPTLDTTEQALMIQRHLADGMTPIIRRTLKAMPKGELPNRAHWWTASGCAVDVTDREGMEMVLDAEGVLQVLRNHWPQVTRRLPAWVQIEPTDELLKPLEDLCHAWTTQAEMEPSLVSEAASSAAKLCRLFGLEETALDMEQIVSPGKNGKSRGRP